MLEYDLLYKIILVGDPDTGKSSLFHRIEPLFGENYKMTIGADFRLASYEVAGKKVKLQIWETGVEERFSSVRPFYYKGAKGCIYFFDITNRDSFENLIKWSKEVKTMCPQIVSLIAGHKPDHNEPQLDRQVTIEEAEELASNICFPYMPEESYIEFSVKENQNIDKLFINLCWFMLYRDGFLPPKQPTTDVEIIPNVEPKPTFLDQLSELPPQINEPRSVLEKDTDILVFLSYSSNDSNRFQIKKFADQLTNFPAIRDVLYWEEDADGSIIQFMNTNIPLCDVFLLFCSQNALQSESMLIEWETAIIFKKQIIPIFEKIEDVPPILRRLRGIKIQVDELDGLVNNVHQLILKKLD